jgi:hypothetical protein
VQSNFLAFIEVVIGGVFDTGFDAMDFVIDFVVLVEQFGEVIIGHFQVVDSIAVLG